MQDIGVIANIKYKKVFGLLPAIIGKFKNFRFRPFYGKKVISFLNVIHGPGPLALGNGSRNAILI